MNMHGMIARAGASVNRWLASTVAYGDGLGLGSFSGVGTCPVIMVVRGLYWTCPKCRWSEVSSDLPRTSVVRGVALNIECASRLVHFSISILNSYHPLKPQPTKNLVFSMKRVLSATAGSVCVLVPPRPGKSAVSVASSSGRACVRYISGWVVPQESEDLLCLLLVALQEAFAYLLVCLSASYMGS